MFRAFLRKVAKYTFIWFFALGWWNLMRNFGQELVSGPELSPGQWTLLIFIMSLCTGLLVSTLETLVPPRVTKRMPFGRAVVLQTSVNFGMFILLTLLGTTIFNAFSEPSPDSVSPYQFLLSKEMLLLITYLFIIVFAIDFVHQVDRSFGPGNLLKMLLGSFHQPKEEDRIFLFLDLRASTTIAEQLGHLQYSQLIQDCFSDLQVISPYQAEVYQYVGDEAVLTWKRVAGLKASNCLMAFFAFKHRIQERADYYQEHYGVLPQFKGGLNGGSIVVAEVGEEKREIAYHGDTINTAARIQSECNARGVELLISKVLFEDLIADNRFLFSPQGEVQLKGKTVKTAIYSVQEA